MIRWHSESRDLGEPSDELDGGEQRGRRAGRSDGVRRPNSWVCEESRECYFNLTLAVWPIQNGSREPG